MKIEELQRMRGSGKSGFSLRPKLQPTQAPDRTSAGPTVSVGPGLADGGDQSPSEPELPPIEITVPELYDAWHKAKSASDERGMRIIGTIMADILRKRFSPKDKSRDG